MTEFAKNHHLDKMKLASGGPLEPYWELYPFHKNGKAVELLSEYKIGTIHPDDIETVQSDISQEELPIFRRSEI